MPWRLASFALLAIVVALAACRGQRAPRVEPYVVAVTAREPALSTDEIESAIALPIEAALANIRSLTSIRTESRAGVATVVAELSEQTGQGEARVKLEAIQAQLPPGVVPELRQVAPDAPEHLVLDVRGQHSPVVLTRMAREWLEPRIERIAGVREVRVRGGQQRQLEVRIDPVRLHAIGATVLDVASVITTDYEPWGKVGVAEDRVRKPADALWQELRDREIGVHGGSPVRLADVAGLAEAVVPARAEPLQIGIRFARGSDRANVAREVAEAVRAELPAGVTIEAAPPVPRAPRVTLVGNDPVALAQAAERVARELGIEVPREPILELDIDSEHAAELGVDPRHVARVIAVAHGQLLAQADDWTDVVMRVEAGTAADGIDVLRVRDARGSLVPLSAVVTQRRALGEPVRLRIDRRPAVEWSVPGGDAADLRRRIGKLALPAHVRARVN